ncbi:MAG: hypothetical protein R3B49_00490 [Phycisphaerales bacterium]
MGRRTVACLGGGVAVVVLVIGGWRSEIVAQLLPATTRDPAGAPTRADASAREGLRDLRMIDAGTIGGVDDLDREVGPLIRERLRAAADGSTSGRTPGALDEVAEQGVELMYYRWLQPSPEAYDAHMRGLGYRRLGLEEMTRNWAIDVAYLSFTGEPMPADASDDEVFDALWTGHPPADRNMRTLRAVSVDRDGVGVAVGRFCPGDRVRWPVPETGLARGTWAAEAGMTMWYEGPGGGWAARQRGGQCFESATVGVVLEFEGGVRVPFLMHFWFDSDSGRWWLGQVTMGPAPGGFGAAIF